MGDASEASDRARELAVRFERSNANLLNEIEGYDDTSWFAVCDEEQATVAAVVSHVAGSYRSISGWARSVAMGEAPAVFTREMIDEGNARYAARYAQRPKDEGLTALRTNAASATDFIAGLSDDELRRSAFLTQFDRVVTVDELIDVILIEHVNDHLRSIRETTSAR